MGFESNRFIELPAMIEDELTCGICCGIFCKPVVTPCGHTFCKDCVMEWFKSKKSCPVCRHNLIKLCKPPVIITNLLARLRIRCKYHSKGCLEILNLDEVEKHETTKCPHHPKPGLWKSLVKSFSSIFPLPSNVRIDNYYDGEDIEDMEHDGLHQINVVRTEDFFHVSLQTVAVVGMLYNCYNIIRGLH